MKSVFIILILTSFVKSNNLQFVNQCERFFINCDQTKYKLTKDDCDYFASHRCEYRNGVTERYSEPILYRQDYYNSSFEKLAEDHSLPTFKCLSANHLKQRLLTDLDYKWGEKKEKWIALIPRKAFPTTIFKQIKYAEVIKTDLKILWSMEDRSEYSEFPLQIEATAECDHRKHNVLSLKEPHDKMLSYEFGEDILKVTDLRLMTIFIIKGDKAKRKCAKIDPVYVDDNEKVNLHTYIVPVQAGYPHYSRFYFMNRSKSPFIDELADKPSAWCKTNRLLMGLSNAFLRNKDGKETQLTGPYYCSLFVNHEERVVRLTFTHNGKEYTVKIVLWAATDKTLWLPMNIELNEKLGHTKIGRNLNFTLEDQRDYENNETFYSQEPQIILGDEVVQLRLDCVGMEFSDLGVKSDFFTQTQHEGEDTLSYDEETTDSSRGAITTEAPQSQSCRCAWDHHTHAPYCNGSLTPSLLKYCPTAKVIFCPVCVPNV